MTANQAKVVSVLTVGFAIIIGLVCFVAPSVYAQQQTSLNSPAPTQDSDTDDASAEGGTSPAMEDEQAQQRCDDLFNSSRETSSVGDDVVAANERAASVSLDQIEEEAAGRDPRSLTGRRVSYEGTDIPVPRPGYTHDFFASTDDGPVYVAMCNPGSTGELYVVELVGEDVYTELADTAPVGDRFAGPGNPSCSQTSRDHNGTRPPINFQYYINASGRQPHLSQNDAIFGMKSGFDRSLTTTNDCGYPDATTYTATVLSTSSVRGYDLGDGYSVMAWNSFTGASAQTIRRVNSSNIVVEADVRYNRDDVSYRFARTITSSCGHSIHLDSTATHEVGHIYGFRHVSGNALTMYGPLTRCTTQKSTLGEGDWRGWNEEY